MLLDVARVIVTCHAAANSRSGSRPRAAQRNLYIALTAADGVQPCHGAGAPPGYEQHGVCGTTAGQGTAVAIALTLSAEVPLTGSWFRFHVKCAVPASVNSMMP